MTEEPDQIVKKIHTIAHRLFVEHGYRGVSMRLLAKECRLGLGRIYSVIESKDALFDEFARPFWEAFEEMLLAHNDNENLDPRVFMTIPRRQRQLLSDLFHRFRDELYVLIHRAQGSKYENFREMFVQRYMLTSHEYLDKVHEFYPELKTDFSEYFLRTRVADWYNIFSELAINPNINNRDIECFLDEFLHYSTAGWRALMLSAGEESLRE